MENVTLGQKRVQRNFNPTANKVVEDLKQKLTIKKPLVMDIIPLTLEEIFIYEMEGLGYDCQGIDK